MYTKKLLAAVMTLTLILAFGFSANAQLKEKPLSKIGKPYEEGKLVTKFKPGTALKDVAELAKKHGFRIGRVRSLSGVVEMEVPKGKEKELEEEFELEDDVEYAEPVFLAYALMVPNDEYYGYQWHMDNSEYGGIQMEQAWDISAGSGCGCSNR